MRRNINIRLQTKSIHATLKDTEELDFFEVFHLFFAGVDLLNEFDLRVLINCEYFEEIGADAIVLLGPDLYHLQNVIAVAILVPLGKSFEAAIILVLIDEALLLEYEGLEGTFILEYFEPVLLAQEIVVIEQEINTF
jgi:hypothetical protein